MRPEMFYNPNQPTDEEWYANDEAWGYEPMPDWPEQDMGTMFEAPEPPMPRNYAERLGMAFGDLSPYQGLGGGASDFAEFASALINAGARTFGKGTQREMKGRQEQQVAQAKLDAQQQQMEARRFQYEQSRARENAAESHRRRQFGRQTENDRLARRRADLADRKFDAQLREQARDNARSDAYLGIAMGAGMGGGGNDPAIQAWAEDLESGRADWSKVPMGKNGTFRNAVQVYMNENKMRVTPTKVRDAIAELGAARGALSQIEALSKQVNSSNWLTRPIVGSQRAVGAVSQMDPDAALFQSQRMGFLAAISRASGEKGVLTDADVARAKGLLPGITDTKDVAQRKLGDLRKFLDQKEAAARRALSTPGAGSGAAPANNDPLGIR